MSLYSRLETLRKNTFVRSVSILAGGTALVQFFSFLALPFITRLYTPEDFSVLAVYSAALVIVSSVACLRLEIAIPMPEDDQDAAGLFVLALISSVLVSLFVAMTVWLASSHILNLFVRSEAESYLWLLPLGVLLASVYNVLQFWATRKKAFTAIAKTNMSQTVLGVFAQIGLGWMGFAPSGLIFGQVLSGGAGVIGLGRMAISRNVSLFRSVSRAELRRLLGIYDRFPKYSALEALANSAAIQAPIIIIAAVAAGPEAGFLMLAMRVMQAPMALIGGAVSQVYLSRAPNEHRAGTLKAFTLRTLGGLINVGVGPLLFAGAIAPVAFSLVFGPSWSRAGVLVMWITPWLIMQFMTSSISMALHVTNNQKIALNLQLVGLLLRSGSVLVAVPIAPHYVAEVYAVSGFVFYMVYFLVILQSVSIRFKDFRVQFRSSRQVLIFWLGFLMVTLSLLRWFYR